MQALIVGTIAVAAAALAPIATARAQSGVASHYSDLSVTASGRSYSSGAMVAAHRTLPFGTKVRVKSASTGRSVVVTIVDRGPFIRAVQKAVTAPDAPWPKDLYERVQAIK